MPASKAKRKKPKPGPPRKRKSVSRSIVKAAQVAVLSAPEKLEQVLIVGDLATLSPAERVDYYKRLCRSLGLNHLTRPFEYILFKEYGSDAEKLSLYAKKDCTEQLRRIHRVSVVPPLRKQFQDQDYYMVEADLRTATGKTDTATGVVALFKIKDGERKKLTGAEYANALMRCETKAKRRGTLSICGLGILDESELDGVEVVGGVTPEGRIWYRDDYDHKQQHRLGNGDTKDSLRERGLWCEEHQCMNNGRHLAEFHAQKLQDAQTKPATSTITRQPAKPPASPQSAPATRVVDAKPAQKPPIGELELDWSESETSPILRGSTLGDVLEWVQKNCHATWGEDQWWHIEPRDTEKIRQLCAHTSIKLTEIPPKPKTSAPTSKRESERGNAAEGGSAGTDPSVVTGIIERVNHVTQQGGKVMAYVTLNIKGEKYDFSSWDKSINNWLEKGKGKEAQVYVLTKGKYKNLVGLKAIGHQLFDESDHKTPIVDNRNREAGGRTLF